MVACKFQQTHTKSQKGNRKVVTIAFEPNVKNPALCLKVAFENYIKVAADCVNTEEESPALIRQLKAKLPYAKNSISADVLKVMKEVGINTDVFKAHSLRMSSATALIDAGMSIESVMKIGGWHSTQVFLKFYHRARRHGAANVINSIAEGEQKEADGSAPSRIDPPAEGNFSLKTAEFFATFEPVEPRVFGRKGRGERSSGPKAGK